MPMEQKSSFEKIEPEQPREQAIEETEKERREINEKIYEKMEETVERIRNAWMKDKPNADWKERGYTSGEDEKTKQRVCEFDSRTKEILVSLIKERNIDFTRGYTYLVDAISDPSREVKMDYREHRKIFSPDFNKELRNKFEQEFKLKEEKRHGETELVYYKKGQEGEERLFSTNILNYYRREFRLYAPEYQLGYGLEKLLGGSSVTIEESYVAIKEAIDYTPEKKWFISPETAIKDIVGRLRIEKIPTITSGNKEWQEFYKE